MALVATSGGWQGHEMIRRIHTVCFRYSEVLLFTFIPFVFSFSSPIESFKNKSSKNSCLTHLSILDVVVRD